MTTLPTTPSFKDPDVLVDPFPVFDQLRESAPIYRDETINAVIVTLYEDIMTVLRDTDTYSNGYYAARTGGAKHSSAVAEILATGCPAANVLSNTDGDVHEFHAGLVRPFVKAGKVREMETVIKSIVDELLDKLRPHEVTNIVSQFAEELAIAVMCEFVGVSRSDRELFAEGADAEVSLLGGSLSEDQARDYARTYVRMQRFLEEQIKDRQENPRDDLVSLIATTSTPDGLEPISHAERVRLLQQVVVAGNETTRALITSSILRLAGDHDLLEQVRNSDQALEGLIEETLRADAPVPALFRIATKNTVLSGYEIGEGETVVVAYGSANHDDAVFACPGEFQIARDNVRKHLAFGFGTHFCLGAPLARLEARIAIGRLVNRFPQITLAPGSTARYTASLVCHNLASLEVVLG